MRSCRDLIAKVNLARMNSFISNNSHNIQTLLDFGIQPLLNEGSYICIDVLAGLAKKSAELLDAKP